MTQHNWPFQRGFDRFYGTIHGGGSYYDPYTLTRDNTQISPYADPEYKPESFYYTDAISDHAVRFLAEHGRQHADKPFFLYVAFTAAHWPMHALAIVLAPIPLVSGDGTISTFGFKAIVHANPPKVAVFHWRPSTAWRCDPCLLKPKSCPWDGRRPMRCGLPGSRRSFHASGKLDFVELLATGRHDENRTVPVDPGTRVAALA